MSLCSRFAARNAGYVSLKSEESLKELGIVSERSQFATRTAVEYCVRILTKTCSVIQDACANGGERILNFCFDAATVGEESVTCLDASEHF